jgi:nucleoside-diphosphate-sugar epimerase
MNVLVIGATGYIGAVVASRLGAAGHHVTALLQPERLSDRPPDGASVAIGDLADPESLGVVAQAADAVVNLATPTGDLAVDQAATRALLQPLRGTGRPFVYTSGIWVLGATGPVPVDEDAPTNPLPIVGYRPVIEQQVLAAADDGVRSVVIRPAIAHGRGGGIPALLVARAREDGVGRYVGGDRVTWPMVHVDDLADLYVSAVERAPAGVVLHAVDEQAVPTSDVAAAAARAAGVAGVRAWPVHEARAVLGEAFADALAVSQACSGQRARRMLGWSPTRPGACEDIAFGSYATAVPA